MGQFSISLQYLMACVYYSLNLLIFESLSLYVHKNNKEKHSTSTCIMLELSGVKRLISLLTFIYYISKLPDKIKIMYVIIKNLSNYVII